MSASGIAARKRAAARSFCALSSGGSVASSSSVGILAPATARHRSLWRAVLMDRLGYVSEREGRQIVSDLIKLRDLSDNCWNVDDMYILTDTLDQAQELQRIQEEEQWLAGNVTVIENQQELSRALGSFPASGFIISFWWD